jgi:hypothetical protein
MRRMATLRGLGECVLLASLFTQMGCVTSREVGKGATQGVLNEVRNQSQPTREGPPPVQQVTENVVKGTLSQLDEAETRAQLRRIVGTTTRGAIDSVLGGLMLRGANGGPTWGGGPPSWSVSPVGALGSGFSEGFTLGLSRQLQVELGPNGEGPLGQTLTRVVEHASAAAVTGAVQHLAPMTSVECGGLDSKACADMRVYELSRSAANGFVSGLVAAFRLPLMILAFAGGFAVALIGALLLFRRRGVWVMPAAPGSMGTPRPPGG